MYVELGKVVGVWGVKGWIKLHSFGRNRMSIADYSNWWLQKKKDDPVSYQVLNCRQQGRGIVAQLDGVNDPDQGMALKGHRILVKETDLPSLPEGEYYWHQLVGLLVSNSEKEIGKISSILDTGANDVLVIAKQEQADVLIPYTKEVVKSVDLELGQMLVDWDPSFLE